MTVQILDEIDRQIERFLLVQMFSSSVVAVTTWLAFRALGAGREGRDARGEHEYGSPCRPGARDTLRGLRAGRARHVFQQAQLSARDVGLSALAARAA